MKRPSLKRFLYLSIAAAITTIGLKFAAYFETGSMGFFSDALESLVNLFAAIIALVILHISEKPADEEHEFGHGKAQYFSSALEGALILIAAVSIIYTSVPKILKPEPLENIGLGTLLSGAAALTNLIVGFVLTKKGKKYNSLLLEADGKHLLSDVVTSVGVILGVIVVKITGLYFLDPIIAIGVALYIVYVGFKLIVRSTNELMDAAIPKDEQQRIVDYLDSLEERNIEYHSLLTREAGYRRFVTFHLLVPGKWSIKQGHDCAEEIEQYIEQMFINSNVTVTSHIEPIEDPISFNDIGIDRLNYSEDIEIEH
ncbi:MAG: cation transporter [Proteiniphilum sp.]|nr:cation transporter [Proteiniphilum sp.]